MVKGQITTLKFAIFLIVGFIIALSLIGITFKLKEVYFPTSSVCLGDEVESSLDSLAFLINQKTEGESGIILREDKCALVGFFKSGATGNINTPTNIFQRFNENKISSFLCVCELNNNECVENYCKEIEGINSISIYDGEKNIIKKGDGLLKELFFAKDLDHLFINTEASEIESEFLSPKEGQKEYKSIEIDEQREFYYPIYSDSRSTNLRNWGDRRKTNGVFKRCHVGNDIFTKGEGRIRAITKGKVINIYTFTNICSGGPAIALIIDHGDFVVNYGEINEGDVAVSVGEKVEAGQFLGKATTCGMLHLEVYKPGVSSNIVWYSDEILERKNNICAELYLENKDDRILNPIVFLDSLESNKIVLTEQKEISTA